jgi:N-acetylmuramoyl-L-alanine amidase
MKKCVLVVGHKPDRPGACNQTYRICEFEFNDTLVNAVMESLMDSIDPDGGIELVKVLRKEYPDLPFEINKLNPDFIVSFHANSFNSKVSGTETLYCYGSTRGEKMAQTFQRNMVTALGLPNRGVIPKRERERGGHLLRYTNAPAIILEPFFIDNDSNFERFVLKRQLFISAIQKSLFEVADII